ncbi:MAG: glycogen synthase GlgA [Candidatus Omnitrophica bacterium]|nr:glycogen synthase GlgA [Candidatus Omnitrophota bacterium]
MSILFVSSEAVPYSKTGGLADVAGSLPVALQELGCEVTLALPLYRETERMAADRIPAVEGVSYRLDRTGVRVLFVEHSGYFGRPGIYGEKGVDYPDNLRRFNYFTQKVLEHCKSEGFAPDILHLNDWQCALFPLYLKESVWGGSRFFAKTKTVFTIHNLAYQGLFEAGDFAATGLSKDWMNVEALEFYGRINLLKGGITQSDALTTVSPSYSREIQRKEFGCGLEGVLKQRASDLTGILNGLDIDEWDPEIDEALEVNYTAEVLEDKALNKKALQRELGLVTHFDGPLVGVVSRLASQKGVDLLVEVAKAIYALGMQLVVLGTGDPFYEEALKALAGQYPEEIAAVIGFDSRLARRIYAGSDIFLMPSRYEPCGLGQMISLRYGAVPVVRATGGLRDTVSAYRAPAEGTGFLFEEYRAKALVQTLQEAMAVYHQPELWKALVRRGMSGEFSWTASARKYLKLYRSLCENVTVEVP